MSDENVSNKKLSNKRYEEYVLLVTSIGGDQLKRKDIANSLEVDENMVKKMESRFLEELRNGTCFHGKIPSLQLKKFDENISAEDYQRLVNVDALSTLILRIKVIESLDDHFENNRLKKDVKELTMLLKCLKE